MQTLCQRCANIYYISHCDLPNACRRHPTWSWWNIVWRATRKTCPLMTGFEPTTFGMLLRSGYISILFTNFVMNDRDSPQSSSPNIGYPHHRSIHTYTYIYIHIYTNIHIHTYIQLHKYTIEWLHYWQHILTRCLHFPSMSRISVTDCGDHTWEQ